MSIKKLKDRYNFIQQISGRKGVNVFIGYLNKCADFAEFRS